MSLEIGQVVAFCYCGTHGTRRIRNATVTKVKKTFIEIDDGSRYSAIDLRQTRGASGTQGLRFSSRHSEIIRNYYLDEQVSFWDGKDVRDQAIREIDTAFETLVSAARNRNWENTKAAFEALNNLIGD